MKKNMLQLAREELLLLDQSIRDCSDRLAEMSPGDKEVDRLREAIKKANALVRAELDNAL